MMENGHVLIIANAILPFERVADRGVHVFLVTVLVRMPFVLPIEALACFLIEFIVFFATSVQQVTLILA